MKFLKNLENFIYIFMVKNINEKDFKVFYNLLPTTLPTRMHFEYNCVTKLRVNCGISTKFHLYLILTIIHITKS